MTGGQAAVLLGLVTMACISALSVIWAFFHKATRFCMDAMHRRQATFADRLCVGISMTAAGTVVAGAAVVHFLFVGTIASYILFLGWALMGAGYFFQFTAWHTAVLGKMWWFRVGWGLFLIVLVGGGAVIIWP